MNKPRINCYKSVGNSIRNSTSSNSSLLSFQEEINQKDQNLRRNAQEIETLTFLNSQLKTRFESLQKELQEHENHGKSKKPNSNSKQSTFVSYHDDVLSQELESKIKQCETMHRRVRQNQRRTFRDAPERKKLLFFSSDRRTRETGERSRT